jgi:transcription elongation factor Elf1
VRYIPALNCPFCNNRSPGKNYGVCTRDTSVLKIGEALLACGQCGGPFIVDMLGVARRFPVGAWPKLVELFPDEVADLQERQEKRILNRIWG